MYHIIFLSLAFDSLSFVIHSEHPSPPPSALLNRHSQFAANVTHSTTRKKKAKPQPAKQSPQGSWHHSFADDKEWSSWLCLECPGTNEDDVGKPSTNEREVIQQMIAADPFDYLATSRKNGIVSRRNCRHCDVQVRIMRGDNSLMCQHNSFHKNHKPASVNEVPSSSSSLKVKPPPRKQARKRSHS